MGEFLLQQLLESSAARIRQQHRTGPGKGERAIAVKREQSPTQAALLLNWMTERRSRGDAFSSIAASLNAQGLRGGYGGRWYSATVRSYLHRHAGNAPASSKGE